jgi:hypothetical protein
MKMILAGLAFAALLTPAVLAQSQSNEGSPSWAIYQRQAKQSAAYNRDLYLPMQSALAPAPNLAKQWPCDTAPDFCPGYHGDND